MSPASTPLGLTRAMKKVSSLADKALEYLAPALPSIPSPEETVKAGLKKAKRAATKQVKKVGKSVRSVSDRLTGRKKSASQLAKHHEEQERAAAYQEYGDEPEFPDQEQLLSRSFITTNDLRQLNRRSRMNPAHLFSELEARLADPGFIAEAMNRPRPDGTLVDGSPLRLENDLPATVPSFEDEPYQVVSDKDVLDAIAYFVAQCVVAMPEVQQLDPSKMARMLGGTFEDLREKGMISTAWGWGQFLYTTYGWGMTAYDVYREPAMAMMVVTTLWKCCKWLLLLL